VCRAERRAGAPPDARDQGGGRVAGAGGDARRRDRMRERGRGGRRGPHMSGHTGGSSRFVLALISTAYELTQRAESTVPTKARRFVFVADADTALADRLEALFEALPASDVDVLRLRLDARACLGADWATVGAGLGTRSCAVKSVSLAFAPDVGRNVIERVVGDLRMGLREWQGEDTRTFVDVE
jgi:hypothetical protein